MLRFRLRIIFALSILLLSLPAQAWAEVYGGIEIGAKGIRAIVIDASGDDDPKLLMIDNKNTTLVAALAKAKRYTPEALEETAGIIGEIARKMRAEFKLPATRLYVVGSSGIFVPIEGDDKLIAENKELLVKAIEKSSGVTMDFVSVTREAELTITSIIPPRFRQEAVLLDIGSGNTKGGLYQKNNALLTFDISFGTVALFDLITKSAGTESFTTAAERLRKQAVLPALRKSLDGKPELVARKRVYIAGGSFFAMTTFQKPADRGDFVSVSHADIVKFRKLVLDNPKGLPEVDLSTIADEKARIQAARDITALRKTFTRDHLVAGTEIMLALVDAFQLDDAGKQIYFARNGYIGWILGYTVEKSVRR